MNNCTAVTFFGPCPFPAERSAKAMCVHEHVREGALCAEHLCLLDGADCLACFECADSHRCPLTFADQEATRS